MEFNKFLENYYKNKTDYNPKKYKEIFKLKNALNNEKIQYEFVNRFDGFQIFVNGNIDIIETYASECGFNKDELEIKINDDIIRHLKYKQALKFIKENL